MNANSADAQLMVPPGLAPPPGVTPNFVNPYSIMGPLKVFDVLLVLLTSLTTLLRIYTKLFLIKSFGWSDYLMILTWLGFVPDLGLAWSIFSYGAGVHQWDVPVTHLVPFAKLAHIMELIYIAIIATAKLSISLQLMNIFTPSHNWKYWMTVGFNVVHIFYSIIFFFVTMFQCKPLAKTWDPTIPGTCMEYQHILVASGVTYLVSDCLMLVFPIFCIWSLQISRDRKYGISAVFLVGMLAVVASVLRVIFSCIVNNSQDDTFTLPQVAACAAGEVAAGILVGNLVCLPRFFTAYGSKFHRLTTLYSRSSRGSRDTHNSKSSSLSYRHASKSESGEYVELNDQSATAHCNPALKPSLGRPVVVVSSPQPLRAFLCEGDDRPHQDGVWRSVRIEQSMHRV